MRRDRPFWQESDSTVTPEKGSAWNADDARGRQQIIGAELRRWYDAIANESVPDEWLELLNQSDGGRENGQSERVGPT
jgi:hypothetical protein